MRPWSYVNDAIAKTKLCITVIQVMQHICQATHRITQLSTGTTTSQLTVTNVGVIMDLNPLSGEFLSN